MEKQPQLDENQLNPNIIELQEELAEITQEVKELKQYDSELKQKIARSQISRSNCSSSAYSRRLSNNFWSQLKLIAFSFGIAGYQDINVSQKTFPIPYLHLSEPQGRELQMRVSLEKPIRNKITTQQAARLMYEIVTAQAVSKQDSQKMLELLTIDAATRVRKREIKDSNTFNPVRGYFSQSLPDDVYFAAKAGWTSRSRQETAYIATPDGKTRYILTIFAEDHSYAYDWKIFPTMSVLVFEHMTKRT